MPEIRTLTNEDTEAWLRLRLEGLHAEPYSFSKSPEEQRPVQLESANGFTLGAFDGGAFDSGALIGIATFIREGHAKERHKGHVLGVYVTPAHRGKGVGEALMAALIAKARKDASLEQIALGVMETSAAAVKLYLRCGFTSWGVEPRAVRVGAEYVAVNHMLLQL